MNIKLNQIENSYKKMTLMRKIWQFFHQLIKVSSNDCLKIFFINPFNICQTNARIMIDDLIIINFRKKYAESEINSIRFSLFLSHHPVSVISVSFTLSYDYFTFFVCASQLINSQSLFNLLRLHYYIHFCLRLYTIYNALK